MPHKTTAFFNRNCHDYGAQDEALRQQGAAYFGYKGLRLGINSDRHVRHPIQDIGAHWWVKKQPGFRSYSNSVTSYFQYQSYNRYTLW